MVTAAAYEPNVEMEGRLTSPEAIRKYALAGRATFTLRSRRTGTRYTFKVSRAEEVTDITAPAWKRYPTWFVSLLTGDDNENSFTYMGIIRDKGNYIRVKEFSLKEYEFNTTSKSTISASAPSAVAFEWFMANVVNGDFLPDSLEVWHEGRCGRCGRKLTVPESVAAGIGPDCAEMGY